MIGAKVFLPALLLMAGCQPSAIHASSTTAVGVKQTEKFIESSQSRLCVSEGPCCVTRVMNAGFSAQGHELDVVVAAHGSCNAPEVAPADDEGTCEDYWLVERRKSDGVPPLWIGNACDGTKTEILTSVDQRMHTFTFGTQSGYSTNVTHDAVTIGLDPVRLVATDAWTQSSSHLDHRSWSWDTFSGALELGVDYCPGKEPAGVDVGTDRDAPLIGVNAIAIPQVTLPEAFIDGGWRTVSLGRCAARMDAAFELVLSPENDLFLEVQDDEWTVADHLEIWMAVSADCVDPAAPSRASGWQVRMLDGQVSADHGVQSPTVESQRKGDRVRLRVRLGTAMGASDRLTVVYSDSDDGVHAKSRVATSELQDGKWWTLGAPHRPDAEVATEETACEIESGKLMPRIPSVWRPVQRSDELQTSPASR